MTRKREKKIGYYFKNSKNFDLNSNFKPPKADDCQATKIIEYVGKFNHHHDHDDRDWEHGK